MKLTISRLLQRNSLLIFLIALLGCETLAIQRTKSASFPLQGTYEEVWAATLETLEAQKIPLLLVDQTKGYIQSKTFPLFDKEYKKWANKPIFAPPGLCLLEIGIAKETEKTVLVGIRAYFKRKNGFYFLGYRKKDASLGVFEGLLIGQINDHLVKNKFPALRSVVIGCNFRYQRGLGRYVVVGAEENGLAYEQGFRDGDVILKIDGNNVQPDNLFQFFLNVQREETKRFTVRRGKDIVTLIVSVFNINADRLPHFGMTVERDNKKQKFIITQIEASSPAEKMGLKAGDVLIKENGILLDGWKNYYRALILEESNVPQTFLIERNKEIITRDVIPIPK